MSSDSTVVTARHFEYVRMHTRPEDGFLLELKAAARAAGIPPIWIAPEQANLLQILLRASGARRVVEVGTLAGYSAIVMARALPPEGRVETFELDPGHAAFAAEWASRSDVRARVLVHQGDAHKLLPRLPAASADAAFLDADKGGYPAYLRECLRIVRLGGLILVDNAFAFGELFADQPRDRETPAVRRFNEIMAATREVQSVIVPLGDGMWVGVKIAEPAPAA